MILNVKFGSILLYYVPGTVDTVTVGIFDSPSNLPGEGVKDHDTFPLTGCGQDLPIRVEFYVENSPWTGNYTYTIRLLLFNSFIKTWYMVLDEHPLSLPPPHVPGHAVEGVLGVLKVRAELRISLAK